MSTSKDEKDEIFPSPDDLKLDMKTVGLNGERQTDEGSTTDRQFCRDRVTSQTSEPGDNAVDVNTDERQSVVREMFVIYIKPFVMPLISIALFCVDVGFDIDLAVKYRTDGKTRYFLATLLCIVIPHICLALIDLQMVYTDRERWIGYFKDDKSTEKQKMVDENKADSNSRQQSEPGVDSEQNNNANNNDTKKPSTSDGSSASSGSGGSKVEGPGCFELVFHQTGTMVEDQKIYTVRMVLGAIGLGYIVRKFQQIYFKVQSQSSVHKQKRRVWFNKKKFEAKRDSSHLGLILSFLEDCPQAILQVYILVQNPAYVYTRTGRSIVTSCLGMSFNFLSYYKENRRQVKWKYTGQLQPDLHKLASVVLFIAIIGAVTARTLSIGLFMGSFSYVVMFCVLAVHFIGNIFFIHLVQKPTFMGLSFSEDGCWKAVSKFFNILLYAWINLFLYYDISGRDGKKLKILCNNAVLFVENLTFVILAVVLGYNGQTWIYCLVIGTASVVHVTLTSIYYALLHPITGRIFGKGREENL